VQFGREYPFVYYIGQIPVRPRHGFKAVERLDPVGMKRVVRPHAERIEPDPLVPIRQFAGRRIVETMAPRVEHAEVGACGFCDRHQARDRHQPIQLLAQRLLALV